MFSREKAAQKLSELVKAAGPNGMPREKAWEALGELQPPADNPQLRGQVAFLARIQRFGDRYVHRSLVNERRQERKGTETFEIHPGNGEVEIRGDGLQLKFEHVTDIRLTRRIGGGKK